MALANLRHRRGSRLLLLYLTYQGIITKNSLGFPKEISSAILNQHLKATSANRLVFELSRGGGESIALVQQVTHRGSVPLAYTATASATFDRLLLWTLPLFGALFSFGTFKIMSTFFHEVVQWASAYTWFPTSTEEVALQTNVVTQVVNGPVITSISILFATLVSLTVSNLYSHQVNIQASLIQEVATIRRLQHLLVSETAIVLLNEMERSRFAFQFQRHKEQLMMEHQCHDVLLDPYNYIESNILHILDSINDKLSEQISFTSSSDFFLSQMRDLTTRILQERSDRWLAIKALHFPAVHYVTLSLLALSIGVSFLVATDGAEFIFLHGLPIRILWSLLVTSFTALAALCYDLSRPFDGAYHVVK